MALPADVRSLGPVAWYYLATPVFLLLDALWGLNVRVVALDDTPVLKYLYYAFCLACGVATSVRPKLTAVVGMTESSVNMGLVVIAIPLAYYRVLWAMAEAQPVVKNPFTAVFFVNLGLSALVWFTAYSRHERALLR